MAHATADDLLMAQAVADAIGATKRQVQLWTDTGAIRCIPDTDRQGRGRQRLYTRSELPIAALVAEMARCKLPIGALIRFSQAIRAFIERKVITFKDGGYILLEVSDESDPWFVWCGDESVVGEHLEKLRSGVLLNVNKIMTSLEI